MKYPVIYLLMNSLLIAQTVGTVPRVFVASKSGIVLDCNPVDKSGACSHAVENAAAVKAVLARGTSDSPVKLVIDGGASVFGGIEGPCGYWEIEGIGLQSGFVVAPGSNSHGIRNVPGPSTFTYNTTPGTPCKNIRLADFTINGNRGDGSSGNSNGGDPRYTAAGYFLFNAYFDNVQHLVVDHVQSLEAPSYNFDFNACTDCVLENSSAVDPLGVVGNGDGIDVNGPSSKIRLDNDAWVLNDDCNALNSGAGYGGLITDVVISNQNCYGTSALRLVTNEGPGGPPYGAPASQQKITNILYVNGSGTIAGTSFTPHAFALGYNHSETSNVDLMQNIQIQNSAFRTTNCSSPFVYVADTVGQLSMSNVTWVSPCGAQPFITWDGAFPGAVSSFACITCKIYRNSDGNAAAFWSVIPSGASFKRAEWTASSINDMQNQSYTLPAYGMDIQSGGSIGTLRLNGFDLASVSGAILNGNQWSRVTKLVGQALTATSGSIGGGALAAGVCATGTVTVSGATTAMAATATPVSADPTNGGMLGVSISARVSAANTVTVSVCAPVAGTPAASTYAVVVAPGN